MKQLVFSLIFFLTASLWAQVDPSVIEEERRQLLGEWSRSEEWASSNDPQRNVYRYKRSKHRSKRISV